MLFVQQRHTVYKTAQAYPDHQHRPEGARRDRWLFSALGTTINVSLQHCAQLGPSTAPVEQEIEWKSIHKGSVSRQGGHC